MLLRKALVFCVLQTICVSSAMAALSPAIDHVAACRFLSTLKEEGLFPGVNDVELLSKIGICKGTIVTLIISNLYAGEGFKFCPPSTGTVEEAARVMVKFMENHPEQLHKELSMVGMLAFQEAWPCK
jgi:Ssp1 endopeptidase immunity protein Rap1a